MVYLSDDTGDNIEFTAVNAGTYVLNLAQGTDSEFVKNATPDPNKTLLLTARCFSLKTDQNVNITKMNGRTFTNPISVILNKEHTEKRNNPVIMQLTLDVQTANTKIALRWF